MKKKDSISRRDFIKGVAAGTASLVAMGTLGACSSSDTGVTTSGMAASQVTASESAASIPAASEPTAGTILETPVVGEQGTDITWDQEADLVVIGAGNGGLSAAAAAASEGKKPLVIEISGFIGGGSAYSGGGLHCWGNETWEDYNTYTEGLHDQILGKVFVETFRNELIPFYTDEVKAPLTKLDDDFKGYKRDYQLGDENSSFVDFFDILAAYIEDNGGQILKKTRGVRLVVDESGAVCGVEAQTVGEESVFKIKAGAVVLATGGFQSNKGLLSKYMGTNAENTRIMGTPYNTGSGMLMAEAVGAMTWGHFSGFSGTMAGVCSGRQTEEQPELYEEARAGNGSLGQGRPYPPEWVGYLYPDEGCGGILINLDGKRFIDEMDPVTAKYCRIPQNIVQQRKAMAIEIADKQVTDKYAPSEALVEACMAAGVNVVTAETLEDFAQGLHDAYGISKGAFLRMINEYNEAIENGEGDMLDVTRSSTTETFSEPPFYAIPVTAAIYHTFGGLAINENAQVLSTDFGPITNLFACPPCAGIFREVYGGGIASAGTFGYIAGKYIGRS